MLGTRIALCRKAHGLSQSGLADRLHISSSAVGMYEQGRREPPCDILIALSRELDVTVDYLLTGEALVHHNNTSNIPLNFRNIVFSAKDEPMVLVASLLVAGKNN